MQLILLLQSFLFCALARLVSLFRQPSNEHYVVGSNYGALPDPNAIAMVNHLLAQKLDVVFISGYSQIDATEIVSRGSYRAAKLFISARAVFYTHSLSDVLPAGHKLAVFKKMLNFPFAVFLQHGVIGLKSMLSSGVSMRSYIMSLEPTFHHMVVSSRHEAALVSEMGVPKRKIALTGLPRFDAYPHQDHQKRKRKILMFFTWQAEDLLKSKVEAVYRALRSIGGLGAEYQICIAAHHMQNADSSLATGMESVAFLSPDQLQRALPKCALLITDDSSVCWDVFYLGGEVLFFKPLGKWLVSDTQLDLRVSHTEDQLAHNLGLWFNGKFLIKHSYTEYRDQSNASRVFKLVERSSNGPA